MFLFIKILQRCKTDQDVLSFTPGLLQGELQLEGTMQSPCGENVENGLW